MLIMSERLILISIMRWKSQHGTQFVLKLIPNRMLQNYLVNVKRNHHILLDQSAFASLKVIALYLKTSLS